MPKNITQEAVVSFTRSFWSHVDKSAGPNSCWLWLGTRDADGYGRAWDGRGTIGAHRIAFELLTGILPQVARHTCDNPPCCNPFHILDGTPADNVRDMIERHRRRGPTKLDDDTALEIVRSLAAGMGSTAVARLKGVSVRIVQEIRAGRNWKHIPRPPNLPQPRIESGETPKAN